MRYYTQVHTVLFRENHIFGTCDLEIDLHDDLNFDDDLGL